MVWLLPELDRTVRWQDESGLHAVALPSERTERIEVYHVGANGQVFGPNTGHRFANGNVEGLLDAWLNPKQLGPVDLFLTPSSVGLEVPTVSGREIIYKPRTIQLAPHGVVPMVSMDEASGEFTGRWPPESSHRRTISPDAESEALYGPFEFRGTDNGLAVGAKFPGTSLAVFARWPEPLRNLVPEGDGSDIGLAQQRMKHIAEQSSTDLARALQKAKDTAGSYVSGGQSFRELAWFWPTYLLGGEAAVLFGAEDFGIRGSSMAELRTQKEFRDLLLQRLNIRRGWGPLGLLWELLIQRLEDGQHFGSCASCGRIIAGKKSKRFCNRKDAPSCFARRRAADQRRSRSR